MHSETFLPVRWTTPGPRQGTIGALGFKILTVFCWSGFLGSSGELYVMAFFGSFL